MTLNSFSSILITGGTGSFGKYFIQNILQNHPQIKRLVIFSRDELKQWDLQQQYPSDKFPQLRFFIGDIRDKSRIKRALEDVELVIHAAALKQVPAAEYNPIEFIYTNVIGAQNLVEASLDSNVKKVIALSTDKAAAPINLYGATKLCSDKLFLAANNITGKRELSFSVVRWGNVMGSRGSVIPYFLKQAKTGILPITDPKMTRFNITLKEAHNLLLFTIINSKGGEIFVPKIPSINIMDLAEAISPSCEKKIIGIRPGEKLHEEMITESDGINSYEFKDYYCILPNKTAETKINIPNGAIKLSNDFKYSSGNNEHFLNIKEIRSLIRENIDKSFEPV